MVTGSIDVQVFKLVSHLTTNIKFIEIIMKSNVLPEYIICWIQITEIMRISLKYLKLIYTCTNLLGVRYPLMDVRNLFYISVVCEFYIDFLTLYVYGTYSLIPLPNGRRFSDCTRRVLREAVSVVGQPDYRLVYQQCNTTATRPVLGYFRYTIQEHRSMAGITIIQPLTFPNHEPIKSMIKVAVWIHQRCNQK